MIDLAPDQRRGATRDASADKCPMTRSLGGTRARRATDLIWAFRSALVLGVLRLFSSGHQFQFESLGGQPARVLIKHPRFVIETDANFLSKFLRAVFSTDPELLVGEGYMSEAWSVCDGELEDVLSTFWNVAKSQAAVPVIRKILNTRRFKAWQKNTPEKCYRNIQSHYDAENSNNALFHHMLGEVPCYSAALFDPNHQTLAEAQNNKIDIIVEKLDMKSGMQVLDIGCGWGVLSRRLALLGCNVTGITLSSEQLRYCVANANFRGTEKYTLEDYRTFFSGNTVVFDRITCIEVLDHVGLQQFNTFFQLAHRNLKDDGKFVLQVIVRPVRGQTSGWIQKYIYPGGYIASINEITSAYKRAGFRAVSETPISGAHYAKTLREWRAHLLRAWPVISPVAGLDEACLRKWLFFLSYSISAFEDGGFMNYH